MFGIHAFADLFNFNPVFKSGLSWDAGLKYTNVELESLQDLDMYLFLETGIRGGISVVSQRYARANNAYMETYNPNQAPSFLHYIDANNLYGWAMMEQLPISGFRWIDPISFTTEMIQKYSPDSSKG